jgi:Rod binding domain-containing protein
MNVEPLQPLASASTPLLAGARLAQDQADFASILSRARAQEEDPERQARAAAEQLVSTALVQPIFKRLRESNNAAPPFGPGKVERTFGPMLDATFAQRMVSSQRWGLVDALARRMLAKGATTTP